MKPRIIQQGAEAIISLNNNQITKHRIKKSYRIPEIDEKLRLRRTKSEAKIIEKLSSTIKVPKIIKTDKESIILEYIRGKKLSESLEKLDWKSICRQLGEILARLHNQDIIHGDLTTSNMIYVEKDKDINNKSASDNSIKIGSSDYQNSKSQNQKFKVCLIDFGLGFHSKKIEDKAVDMHLLKQALEAKHYTIWKPALKIILNSYNPAKKALIIKRISEIEKRGRYRGH